MKQGDLWTKEGALVVVGNNELKRGVISLFHDTTTAGHPMLPASRVANHGSMVWLRTGVSSGNQPMFGTKMQKIPLALGRVPAWTEYLEECRSGAAWESLGISEIAQQIR